MEQTGSVLYTAPGFTLLGRTQLRDVLEDLVSQTKDNNKDDTHDSHVEVDEDVEEAARELLEYSSPRKRPYKQRRKRKRAQRDSISDTFSDEERETSSSEVISIYGRHLNLSRLGKAPSLYSICRDWVLNDPLGQVHFVPLSQSNISLSDTKNIYRLPPPEEEEPLSLSQISKPKVDVTTMDRELSAGLRNDDMTSLKNSYLQKWKGCHVRMKQLSMQSQERHDKCFKILQEIHQR